MYICTHAYTHAVNHMLAFVCRALTLNFRILLPATMALGIEVKVHTDRESTIHTCMYSNNHINIRDAKNRGASCILLHTNRQTPIHTCMQTIT